jgi:hypothetical protein
MIGGIRRSKMPENVAIKVGPPFSLLRAALFLIEKRNASPWAILSLSSL